MGFDLKNEVVVSQEGEEEIHRGTGYSRGLWDGRRCRFRGLWRVGFLIWAL